MSLLHLHEYRSGRTILIADNAIKVCRTIGAKTVERPDGKLMEHPERTLVETDDDAYVVLETPDAIAYALDSCRRKR